MAGNDRDFLEIASKGVIYDGYLRIFSCAAPGDVLVAMTVDGIAINSVGLDVFLRYNLVHEGDFVLTLTEYNIELSEFIVSIRRGVTFSETFKTTIFNNSAGDISVVSNLLWAHLT